MMTPQPCSPFASLTNNRDQKKKKLTETKCHRIPETRDTFTSAKSSVHFDANRPSMDHKITKQMTGQKLWHVCTETKSSWRNGCFRCCWHKMSALCEGGAPKGERTVHVMQTCTTCRLSLKADCHATATMKTSRDNQLLMKCLHLFFILKEQVYHN